MNEHPDGKRIARQLAGVLKEPAFHDERVHARFRYDNVVAARKAASKASEDAAAVAEETEDDLVDTSPTWSQRWRRWLDTRSERRVTQRQQALTKAKPEPLTLVGAIWCVFFLIFPTKRMTRKFPGYAWKSNRVYQASGDTRWELLRAVVASELRKRPSEPKK